MNLRSFRYSLDERRLSLSINYSLDTKPNPQTNVTRCFRLACTNNNQLTRVR